MKSILVPPMELINKLLKRPYETRTLLWENTASIGTEFAPQTITLSDSGFDAFAILFDGRFMTGSTNLASVTVPCLSSCSIGLVAMANTNSASMRKLVYDISSPTQLVAQAGYYTNTAASINNTCAVPLKIYGIKYYNQD